MNVRAQDTEDEEHLSRRFEGKPVLEMCAGIAQKYGDAPKLDRLFTGMEMTVLAGAFFICLAIERLEK